MIGPNSPLGTPGFFDQAVFPGALTGSGGFLPGTLPQEMPVMKIDPKMQENYMKNLMAEFMASMVDVQNSFAMYLGAPPATPGAAAPKKK
jgi:hypothetical protein